MTQLVLPLQLADHAVFASFLDHGNETLVSTLVSLSAGDTGQGCWLWGAPATGKTHLLQAVCDRAGDRSVYLPLAMLAQAGPGILEGLASRSLVCIDNIDEIVGQDAWEVGLFNLFNDLQESGGQLIVAARAAPRECGIVLADLASRMSRLPVFQIHALDEQQRVAALKLRARHRGLELPDDTAAYMLKRSRRDMASLYELLDKLDLEALRAQRRLTIPFVREVLQRDANH
ncbi:MAG: DnaA regulatory inactivator Hda [Gammaproteobacteria bacterium]|jgi:DnaA family protein|nr:DnaA regulatory inactivator Hda [Gammaproteobacteria bacterium]